MNFDTIGGLLLASLAVLVIGSLVYRVVKHGGVKGGLFGARIDRTVGKVGGGGPKPASVTVSVHALGDAERRVGLEISAKTITSYQMLPASLTAQEAEKLAEYLQAAVRDGSST